MGTPIWKACQVTARQKRVGNRILQSSGRRGSAWLPSQRRGSSRGRSCQVSALRGNALRRLQPRHFCCGCVCVCGLLLARPLSPCPMPAAGLAEADVQAVLEESRANQAALLGDSCSQPSAAFTPRSSRSGGAGFVAENSCPNSSSTGFGSAAGAGTDTAVHAAPTELPAAPPAAPPAELPAAEVPEARVTVRIRDSSSCATASAAAAGGCAEAEQLTAAAAAASTNLQGAPELVAPTEGGSSSVKGSSPPEAAADSDAEGSASLAGLSENDDEEDEECLDELD